MLNDPRKSDDRIPFFLRPSLERIRHAALLLGFSDASKRYLQKHPWQRLLRQAIYFSAITVVLSGSVHTLCEAVTGHALPSWVHDSFSILLLAALVALLAAALVKCSFQRGMRRWERALLFPVAALLTLLAAAFAAEAAAGLTRMARALFAA